MPQQPAGPVAAKKRPRSSERIRSMLAPTLRSPAGADPFGGASPSSLGEYAKRDYQYNPAGFAPEELAQYQRMLEGTLDSESFYPYSRTDVTGDFYRAMRETPVAENSETGRSYSAIPSRQDSLYAAARLGEAAGAKNTQEVRRRELFNSLMRKMGM